MERGPFGGRGLKSSRPVDLDGLLDELGVAVPIRHAVAALVAGPATPIQSATLADATAGRDLLAVAPTGSGKTLVFGIAVAHQLAGAPSGAGRPRALVVAPTRELAQQNAEVVADIGAGAGLKVATFVGGQPISADRRALVSPVDVAVGTPGRLSDLVHRGDLSASDVQLLVLDEVDHLLSASFRDQTRSLLDRCGSAVLLGVTATAEPEIREFLRGQRPGLRTHHQPLTGGAVADAAPPGTRAARRMVVVPSPDPRSLAVAVATRCRRALFFVPRRDAVESLRSAVSAAGVTAAGVAGSASPSARSRAFTDLASGTVRVLVTTDLAGRGLDIDSVGHVIHVGPPHSVHDLVHRTGRTGRGATPAGVVAAIVRPFEVERVRAQAEAAGMSVDVVNPTAHGPAGLDAIFGPVIASPRRRRDPAPGSRTRRPARSRPHRPKKKRR